MNDIDFTPLLEIVEREIEEAERFASEYRLAINVRRSAGHDTMRDEQLLEQFVSTLQHTYEHYGSLIRPEDQQAHFSRTLH